MLRGQTANNQPGCYSRVRRVLSSELCWLCLPGEDHGIGVIFFLALRPIRNASKSGHFRLISHIRDRLAREGSVLNGPASRSALWRIRVMETRATRPVTRRSPRTISRHPVRAGALRCRRGQPWVWLALGGQAEASGRRSGW